jgi:hypothetical protein
VGFSVVEIALQKVFDEFKNKLAETKALASSPAAKTVRAGPCA